MSVETSIIRIDKELCTGCRRCTDVCPVDAIEGILGEPQTVNVDRCVVCGQCVQKCSAYASAFEEEITPRSDKLLERGMLPSVKEPLFAAYDIGCANKVKNGINNPDLFKMVQCAPAVRVAIGEDFGMPLGSLTPGKMAAALRRLGFDKVYDTNFAADLTIVEEGTELIHRVTQGGTLPMFTSCCPAWVKFMEQEYPDLIDHLSTCRSPQQKAGVLFKTYGAKINNVEPAKVFSVSVMPCTCKKFECDRPNMYQSGFKDVDVVITTRELAQLIKDAGIDFASLPDEEFDAPLGTYTGAGTLFAATGGVMEAALRTGYELITQQTLPNVELTFTRGEEGVRRATVPVGEMEVKIVIVAGLKHVVDLLEEVKAGTADFHFVEVMTCPAGCLSGGGQPKLLLEKNRETAYKNRTASTYKHDAEFPIRKSHENQDVKKLYDEFLGEPMGHGCHDLLHVEHTPRK
ncbi:[FeFe] hydrogenase, group A [Sporomusa sphaeroides DSM 2875]|uniref:[FeFe] hydrogenase, group A n=1 Tax=Sporomusa sphaeroides TaxID=47679 RepID=UPI00202E25C1|nr:[FeFe] hydrogenase, group A [Sporomusa sphaeroides]MCM0761510.1 [FeFe] hydrogenase, group A [Sporomusa sphaeroides DSM 2875]